MKEITHKAFETLMLCFEVEGEEIKNQIKEAGRIVSQPEFEKLRLEALTKLASLQKANKELGQLMTHLAIEL